MYSSTSSLTSSLDGIWWSMPGPGHFAPGTHCIGGWVGPTAGLDRQGKVHPSTGIRSPEHSTRNESLDRLSYPGPVRVNIASN
jgi:hypothetical protein